MYNYSEEIKNWPLSDREYLNLTLLESHGADLEDMLANATISLEDWHGNDGPEWTLGDLSSKDYAAVVERFTVFIADADNDAAIDRKTEIDSSEGPWANTPAGERW